MMSTGIRIRADDVLYNALPLYHANALMTIAQALVTGSRFEIGARFSASRFWENAARAEGTVSYLLGALASRLLVQPPSEHDRAHRIRAILAPGMPVPLWEAFRERFGVSEIVECYGMTETNHCIGRSPGHEESRPGYMGYLWKDLFDARVVDAREAVVPDGTPGELLLRAREPYCFCTGYWAMPQQTLEATRNLWFHTGDYVVREADGCFRFVDRAKDSMRRLGENISSWEVEEAILTHDAVAEVAVFGVPSQEVDEEVMAVIVANDGQGGNSAELIAHLESRLAAFAIPRYIDWVSEMPYTENGKIRKPELRARGLTTTTWDRLRVEG
jgi:carnitine-CoA ligase